MGLADFWNRAKQVAGRVAGTTGNVLKKVGDISGKIVRGVGSIAQPVTDVASALTGAFGAPEIGAAIGSGLNAVSKYGPGIASGISDAGSKLSKFSNSMATQ